MPDFEQRLKALEKRALVDDERWQMLDAQTKAFGAIRDPVIVKNLRDLETDARKLNAHPKMIVEISGARKFFEALANNKGGRSSPRGADESRRG